MPRSWLRGQRANWRWWCRGMSGLHCSTFLTLMTASRQPITLTEMVRLPTRRLTSSNKPWNNSTACCFNTLALLFWPCTDAWSDFQTFQKSIPWRQTIPIDPTGGPVDRALPTGPNHPIISVTHRDKSAMAGKWIRFTLAHPQTDLIIN